MAYLLSLLPPEPPPPPLFLPKLEPIHFFSHNRRVGCGPGWQNLLRLPFPQHLPPPPFLFLRVNFCHSQGFPAPLFKRSRLLIPPQRFSKRSWEVQFPPPPPKTRPTAHRHLSYGRFLLMRQGEPQLVSLLL